jgi:class 3 adenylate cyclase/tetratricopeptide (TPR) repeat protein
MRCSRCNAENPAGMRFCGQCAAPLPVACLSCGAANPPESRFCGSCAAPISGTGARAELAAGMLPGEIKQVTVLFCDIVNSMPLTERLGAEAMRDLVGAFIDTSIAEIHRYGGTAPQFSGDGFMALFGAPVTQEDHVRRALLSALAIRRALDGQGDGGMDRGPEVQIRIGIHTGPVVFGAIGGGFRIDTAIGDTANVAARLQQATEPGTILISEAVHALARGYARVEPVGPLRLKGKPEPVSAFRLIGVSRWHAARDAVTPARLSSFVGRERELSRLESLLERVEDGRGQIAAVVGEPGIGKSRLVAEFRRRIERVRITWAEGQCLSYGAAIPYHLILDVLRNSCGIAESDSAEAIAQKVRSGLSETGLDAEQDSSVLLHLLGVRVADGAVTPSNPETVKSRSFEVLRRFCIEGSRRRPLVLVLEDLHWVDTISEEFFGQLAKQVGDTRILLLATYRPEYRSAWARLANAAGIPLQSLSWDDSLTVVRSVLTEERLADPLAAEIIARADGNPLFLEQLALHAGEAEQRSDLAVPHTIHGVVMARIDRLPEATKQLLQMAAVIGREFSLRLLRAVWNGRGPLEKALDELSRLEFLDEWPDDDGTTYVFRHALTQETGYRSLLARDRRVYHREVGEALEELYPGRVEEVAELLAWHFGRSDEAEKAVDYDIAAAEKSQRRWANSEAEIYFDDAIRRLAMMPDAEANRLRRIEAVLRQAETKYALGRYTGHIRSLLEIRDIVGQSKDPKHNATWHYWTGFLHSVSGGRPDVAIEHCAEAARIASASGLQEINAFAESCLAQVYLIAGKLREAIAAGEQALSSFEERCDHWWAARTLWFLSIAANAAGKWKTSIAYCRRGLDYGVALDEVRFRSVQAVGWWRMGSAYIQQGDLELGIQCCDEALALDPIPRDALMAKAARAYAEVKGGQPDKGVAGLSEAIVWFNRSDLRYTHLFYVLWLAEGHLRRGDRVSARPLLDEVLETSRKTGYPQLEGRACWLMSEYLAAEAPASAEEYAEAAILILEHIGAQNDLALTLLTRAALRQRAGDADAAREFLRRADVLFRSLGTLEEPARVQAALSALDHGLPIGLLSRATL